MNLTYQAKYKKRADLFVCLHVCLEPDPRVDIEQFNVEQRVK
ncbi:hypothetical protein ACO0LC_06615 [Undibacterium sp. JH2W]